MSYRTADVGRPGRDRGVRRCGSDRRSGFTLIELLVVVAIIALLISILLPSLSRARLQAKILTCKANEAQIASMTAQYQTENSGYVPIMYNYYACGHGRHDAPARACWLSVALRHYYPGTAKLKERSGGKFDPEKVWYPETGLRDEYEKTFLPEFFVCPFQRGQGPGKVLVSSDAWFQYYEWQGKHELYQTWLWEDIVQNKQGQYAWPGGPGTAKRGIAKYSVFSWNRVMEGIKAGVLDAANRPEYRNLMYRRWDRVNSSLLKTTSLSNVTTVFCAQGEHNVFQDQPKYGRCNVGSHRTSAGGGTNAVFADGHVEWVVGTRIGWP